MQVLSSQRFSNLPDYAFPRLRTLLADVAPPVQTNIVDMTIGEPKHDVPEFVRPLLQETCDTFNKYPPVQGTYAFQEAVAGWLKRRYELSDKFISAHAGRILPLSGTREGLFLSTIAVCPATKNGKQANVLMPNPFYQCYAAAALACNAQPVYMPATKETGHLPNIESIDIKTLEQTSAVFLCSPANPQGAVADIAYWCAWIRLAEKYNFYIFADECYAEIYNTQPPTGILQAVQYLNSDPDRVIAFHSLSKRSNLAGLRSGFVTSGPVTIQRIQQLRAYGGAPCPLPTLAISTAAWADDMHVQYNRDLYRQKFDIADDVFNEYPGYHRPDGGFFLWLPVHDGEQITYDLWRDNGIKVLPGAYLARTIVNVNPGSGYIRIALVDKDHEKIRAGLQKIRERLAL